MSAPTVGQIATLMRRALMSASYKPALLKALVRIFRVESALDVPLSRIGEEFAKMYWNQTVVYHLRQAVALSKESEVIKAIRAAAASHQARKYSDLPEHLRQRLSEQMAAILALDVLERFHKSAPDSMPPLYTWHSGHITVSSDAAALLQAEHGPLETIANYHWARFLESCNRLAPKIIQKVEANGASRGSLSKYLRILTEDDATCFYCDKPFDENAVATVDHVIPWSFLLEDPLWDLVPACARCNFSKSDTLPEPRFLEKLLSRNAMKFSLRTDVASMLHGQEDLSRLFDAALSLEWPHFWSPG